MGIMRRGDRCEYGRRLRTKKKSETASQEPVPGQVYEKNPNETPMYQ